MKYQNISRAGLLGLAFFIFSFVAACGGPSKNNKAVNEEKLPPDPDVKVQPETLEKIIGVVTPDGYKNVRFGMTAAEAKSVFDGELLEPEHFNNPEFYSIDNKECYYLRPKDTKEAVGFMVVSEIIQRIDVDTPQITTEQGARIGLGFEVVEALYPNSKRKPNFYSYPIPDLIVKLSDESVAIFEQGNGRVTRYRVGIMPAIEFVEGCQ